MTKGKRLIQAITGLVLATLALPLFYAAPLNAITIFTGNVPSDFADSDAIIIVDNPTEADTEADTTDAADPDVVMPSPPYAEDDISGWDVNAIYMNYDAALDMMFVGIDCFTICGDADNNGNPNTAGRAMRNSTGTDVANFGRFESIALLIDTDGDYSSFSNGDFEVVVGVSQRADLDSLGAYQFTGAVRAPYIGFGRRLSNVVTIYSIPNANTPDLEFGIADFSQLPGLDFEAGADLTFKAMLYAGSQRDGKIGEEYVPSRGSATLVTIDGALTEGSSSQIAQSQVAQSTVVPTKAVQTTGATTVPARQPTPTYTPPPTSVPTAVPTATPLPLSSAPPQRLQLPSIGVDTVVEPMGWGQVQQDDGTFAVDWNVVDNAAGWHKNSSLPNHSGNVVLSGHNTIGGSVFRNLFELKDGDEIVIWQDDQRYEYSIDQVVIVPEQYATHEQRVENAAFMDDFGDDRITLISCWPPGSASHRVIVVGKLDK